MIRRKSLPQVLEGVRAAYALRGDQKEFTDWLVDLAAEDEVHGTYTVVEMSAELVSSVVNGSIGSMLEADEQAQRSILVAHQAFQFVESYKALTRSILVQYAEGMYSDAA